MIRVSRYFISLLAFSGVWLLAAKAQQTEPFDEEIRAFKKQDSLSPIPKGAILLPAAPPSAYGKTSRNHLVDTRSLTAVLEAPACRT